MRYLTIVLILVFIGIYLANNGFINSKSVKMDHLDLVDLDGNKVSLADYRGKPILLNFWATWCPPCIKEKPQLEKARQILEKEGYAFVMISEEDLPTIKRYTQAHPFRFNYLKFNGNIKMQGIFSIPQTYIIDKKGNVVFEHTGYKDWSTAESINLLRKHL